MGPIRAVGIAIASALLTAPPLCAEQISREEALALAFPGAAIRSERVFLTAAQRAAAEQAAGTALPSPLVARYVAEKDGRIVGRAYADTHIVRTKKETLLVSLDADGRVRRVDVTAFLEPAEFKAPHAWLNQYQDKSLTDDLRLHRQIRPIAGATRTAQAASDAVRRALAIDRILSTNRADS